MITVTTRLYYLQLRHTTAAIRPLPELINKKLSLFKFLMKMNNPAAL